MPTLQLEQQVCNWVEEPREEADRASYKFYLTARKAASALERSAEDTSHAEPYQRPDLRFRCALYDVNPGQDIWNLAYAVRAKVARGVFAAYESERLIEEINEAYDAEMEREDEEFLKYAKGYTRRLLNAED